MSSAKKICLGDWFGIVSDYVYYDVITQFIHSTQYAFMCFVFDITIF